jgi:excisionase family DNA binding protein
MTTPAAAADLAALLQLLAGLIANGESVRDVLDYCRGRGETTSGPETPGVPDRVGLTVKPPTKSPALLTTAEACQVLRCTRSTLYALFHRGSVKKTKIGGATRWRKSHLERYIEQQTKGAR